MNRAFIFDVDGVLVNNESMWEEAKKEIYVKNFGQEIFEKLGSTLGLDMEAIYKKAVAHGSNVSKDKLFETFFKYAIDIYQNAPLTPGIQELGNTLIKLGYKLGIVFASPKKWVDVVVNRLEFKEHLDVIISLHERSDLLHKPAPDGYIDSINKLGGTPKSTIILEDSNAGIASAKAAGAYTIGLQQNLVQGYKQQGADIYVKNIEEVIQIAKDFSK